MVRWVRLAAVLVAGWAGAVLWAYGIAVLRPWGEPGSYWAGDIRWSVILSVCAALAVLAHRWSVAGLAGLWIVADLVLDRVGLGRPALLPAAIFAGGLVTAAAVVLRDPAPAPPGRVRPGARVAMACVLAAWAMIAIEAPCDAGRQVPVAGNDASGVRPHEPLS